MTRRKGTRSRTRHYQHVYHHLPNPELLSYHQSTKASKIATATAIVVTCRTGILITSLQETRGGAASTAVSTKVSAIYTSTAQPRRMKATIHRRCRSHRVCDDHRMASHLCRRSADDRSHAAMHLHVLHLLSCRSDDMPEHQIPLLRSPLKVTHGLSRTVPSQKRGESRTAMSPAYVAYRAPIVLRHPRSEAAFSQTTRTCRPGREDLTKVSSKDPR